jgi:hypothetical protein
VAVVVVVVVVVVARGSANVLARGREVLAPVAQVVVLRVVDVMNAQLVVDATNAPHVELVMTAVEIAVAVTTVGRLHATHVLRLVTRARRDVSSVTSSPGRASSVPLQSGLRRISVTTTKGRARTVTIATSTA